MSPTACGCGASRIPPGARVWTGSPRWRRSRSSRAASRCCSIRSAPPPRRERGATPRRGAAAERLSSCSSPTTSATSTCSCAGTARARSGRISTGATTCRGRSSSPCSPGDELPGGLRALHDGRGVDGDPGVPSPSSAPSSSRTGMTAPGGELRVWRELASGTASARCRPCARCSRCRSSACSSPRGAGARGVPSSRPRSSASRGGAGAGPSRPPPAGRAGADAASREPDDPDARTVEVVHDDGLRLDRVRRRHEAEWRAARCAGRRLDLDRGMCAGGERFGVAQAAAWR